MGDHDGGIDLTLLDPPRAVRGRLPWSYAFFFMLGAPASRRLRAISSSTGAVRHTEFEIARMM